MVDEAVKHDDQSIDWSGQGQEREAGLIQWMEESIDVFLLL